MTARALDGELLFRNDEDRIGYVLMLAATAKRYGWLVLSYCLMSNHVHLLIETPHANLGEGMRWLHGHYGASVNGEYGREGPLFKRRYHNEPIAEEGHLLNAVGYIAANPVVAGLCDDPRQWRWGSHASARAGASPDWLAHERLLQHLEAACGPNCYEHLVAKRVRAVVDESVSVRAY